MEHDVNAGPALDPNPIYAGQQSEKREFRAMWAHSTITLCPQTSTPTIATSSDTPPITTPEIRLSADTETPPGNVVDIAPGPCGSHHPAVVMTPTVTAFDHTYTETDKGTGDSMKLSMKYVD